MSELRASIRPGIPGAEEGLVSRPRRQSAELARLRRSWERWDAYASRFAKRGGGNVRQDQRSYAEAHEQLLEAFHGVAVTLDGRARDSLEELQLIIRPWLTTTSLARADSELLHSLLERGRQQLKSIGVKVRRPIDMSGITHMAMWAIAAAVAITLAARYLDEYWIRRINYFLNHGLKMVRSAGELEWLAAFTAVVLIVSMFVVSRTAKS